MRGGLARNVIFCAFAMLVGACTDLPTTPTTSASSPGPSRDWMLGPVIVVGHPQCDPYLDLDWCRGEGDGHCMSGAGVGAQDKELAFVSGCSAPGTGIGKGGGAIGSPEPVGVDPGTGLSPESEDLDDRISPQDTVPDCAQTQTIDWAQAFCRSAAPTGARADTINAALDRMEQRGGECASLAAEGRRLLGQGHLRVFSPVAGDAGGWGDARIGVLIADYWVDAFSDTVSSDNRNLEHALSHEIDHELGRDHTDQAGYETPNSRTCSGLTGTSP